MTPEEVESQRRIAQALMQRGMDSSPVGHWTQALARGAQGVVGAFQNDWADTAEREGKASGDKLIADALAGKNTSQAIQGMMTNPWSSDTGRKLAVGQIQQRMQDESPSGKLAIEAKRAQIDAAKWKLANDQSMAPLERQRLQASIAAAERQGELGRMELDQKRQMMPFQQRKLEAETKSLEQKDVLNEEIARMLRPQPQQQAPQPQSPIRPQSMEGAAPDPNLIRTQVGGPAPQQQQQPDMVDTPMGPMSQQDAQRRAFALGLAGKGDAGKMLMEQAQQGRLGKEAANQNDKDQMAAIESVARLDGIAKSFDPKYLEVPSRIEQTFRSMQNKAGGFLGKPTPEQQQELMKFAQFKQQSVKNAALYVKYLSGVAVSEAEFARIMQTLPNAGSGMFDGDSAPEFAAKLQQAAKDSKAAIARANYLRTQGFKGKPWEAGVGLDDMPALIDQRGQLIEQSLRQQNPNADPKQIQRAVRDRLKQEFGI